MNNGKFGRWATAITRLGSEYPSNFSKLVTRIGAGAATVMAGMFALFQGKTVDEKGWEMNITMASFALFFLCFFILAVRRLAIAHDKKANLSSISGVFGRVLLYMFLPAAIITAVTVAIALYVTR